MFDFLKKLFGGESSCGCCCGAESECSDNNSYAATAVKEKPVEDQKTSESKTQSSPVKEKGGFQITSAFLNKVLVIKVLRLSAGYSQEDAEKLLQNLPASLNKKLNNEEAQKLKSELENLGATVEIS